jgi:hypothetical protein
MPLGACIRRNRKQRACEPLLNRKYEMRSCSSIFSTIYRPINDIKNLSITLHHWLGKEKQQQHHPLGLNPVTTAGPVSTNFEGNGPSYCHSRHFIGFNLIWEVLGVSFFLFRIGLHVFAGGRSSFRGAKSRQGSERMCP